MLKFNAWRKWHLIGPIIEIGIAIGIGIGIDVAQAERAAANRDSTFTSICVEAHEMRFDTESSRGDARAKANSRGRLFRSVGR